MEYSKVKKAADILYYARKKLKRIKGLAKNYEPKNLDEAYLIQKSLINRSISTNQKVFIVGYKIGCTNYEAQKQLNVYEPFYGNILSNNISKSNIAINSKNYFKPFVEPEFSFKIKKELSLSSAPYTFKDIFKVVDCLLPSIEIVDSRFTDWTKVGIYNLIADNAVHAHWIYGKENKNLNNFNLNNYDVFLYVNNKLKAKGSSKKVLGNPLNSLTWLFNYLAKKGIILKKNSYISTGTCTPAIPIKKNDSIIADFGKLGVVKLKYL